MDSQYTDGSGTHRTTGRIRTWAATRIEERTTRAADQAEPVVRALQSAATRLDEDGAGALSGYARGAAGRLQNAATYLRDKDAASMLADVSTFARTRPALFVGLSIVAGVALGRALRRPVAQLSTGDQFAAGPSLATFTPGGA